MGMNTAGWWWVWVGLWVVWSGQFGMVSMDYTASNLQSGPMSQPILCGLSGPGLVCNPAGIFSTNQVSTVENAIGDLNSGTNAGCAGSSDGISSAVAAVDKIMGSDGLSDAQLKTKADDFAADLRKNWNVQTGACQNDIILVYSQFGPTIGWSAGSKVLQKISYSTMDSMVKKAIGRVKANPSSAAAVLASTLNNLETSSNGSASKTQIFLYSLGGVLGAIGLILIGLLICACCRASREQDGADLEKAEDEESIVSGSDTSISFRNCCYCCDCEDDAADEMVAGKDDTPIIIPQWVLPDPKPRPTLPQTIQPVVIEEEQGHEEEETSSKKVHFVEREEESEEEVEEEEPEPETESGSEPELEPQPVPIPVPVPQPQPRPGRSSFMIQLGEDGMDPGEIVMLERSDSPEVLKLCRDSKPEVLPIETYTPVPQSPTVVVPPFSVSVMPVGAALRQGNPMYKPPKLVPLHDEPPQVHTYTSVTSPHTTYVPRGVPVPPPPPTNQVYNQQYDSTPTVTVRNNFGKSSTLIDIPEEGPEENSYWRNSNSSYLSNSSNQAPVFLSSNDQPVPEYRPVQSETVNQIVICEDQPPYSKDTWQNTVPEEEEESPDEEPEIEKPGILKPASTGSTTKVKIKCKSKKKKKKCKKSSSESESDSEREYKERRSTSSSSSSDSSSDSDFKRSSSESYSDSGSGSEKSCHSSKSSSSSKSDCSKSEKSSVSSEESKSWRSEESKSSSECEEDEQVSSIASVPRPPTPPISRSRSSKTSRKAKKSRKYVRPEYIEPEYFEPEYAKPAKKRKKRKEEIMVDDITQMTATPTIAKKWSSKGGISNKTKELAYF